MMNRTKVSPSPSTTAKPLQPEAPRFKYFLHKFLSKQTKPLKAGNSQATSSPMAFPVMRTLPQAPNLPPTVEDPTGTQSPRAQAPGPRTAPVSIDDNGCNNANIVNSTVRNFSGVEFSSPGAVTIKTSWGSGTTFKDSNVSNFSGVRF